MRAMTMGLFVKLVFWLLLFGLVANLLVYQLSRRIHAATTNPIPHTSTLTEVATNANGQIGHVTNYILSTRSDGSTVRKVSDKSETFRVIEFASRIHAEIKELHELRSIQTMNSPPLIRNPDLSCVMPRESVMGEETVGGFRAVKINKGVRTSWFVPEYGCALVREVWKFDTGEVSEKTLVSLTKGEPDPVLFHVPASYKEVPPSQIADPDGIACTTCPNNLKQRFAKRDRDYYARRPSVLPQ